MAEVSNEIIRQKISDSRFQLLAAEQHFKDG